MNPTTSQRQGLLAMVRSRLRYIREGTALTNLLGIKANGQTQKGTPGRALPDECIHTMAGLVTRHRDAGKTLEKTLHEVCSQFPIYQYIMTLPSFGVVVASALTAMLDFEIADTVSKIWQYMGVNPMPVNGKKRIPVADYTPSKGTIIGEYHDRDTGKLTHYRVLTGIQVRGDKQTKGFLSPYNKELRTLILGVWASNAIRGGIRWDTVTRDEYDRLPDHVRKMDGKVPKRLRILTKYAQTYCDYKYRLSQRTDTVLEYGGGGDEDDDTALDFDEQGLTAQEAKLISSGKARRVAWRDARPIHREMAARRYMAKMAMIPIHIKGRKLAGLPVREPYYVEKLHMTRHAPLPEFAVRPYAKDEVDPGAEQDPCEIPPEVEETVTKLGALAPAKPKRRTRKPKVEVQG